jgi:hypothetical protein
MPRLGQNSMPMSLHYALTDSQCSICGGQLEWQPDFNDINQPKYISQHCNQEYAIYIHTVKVKIVGKPFSKDNQGHQQEKTFNFTKQDEPKALQMAEAMKRQQQQEDKSKGETNQR